MTAAHAAALPGEWWLRSDVVHARLRHRLGLRDPIVDNLLSLGLRLLEIGHEAGAGVRQRLGLTLLFGPLLAGQALPARPQPGEAAVGGDVLVIVVLRGLHGGLVGSLLLMLGLAACARKSGAAAISASWPGGQMQDDRPAERIAQRMDFCGAASASGRLPDCAPPFSAGGASVSFDRRRVRATARRYLCLAWPAPQRLRTIVRAWPNG